MSDDIVKSPYAALRFTLRHCGVRVSTPHSSGFTRLASGAFYFVVSMMTFYEFIMSKRRRFPRSFLYGLTLCILFVLLLPLMPACHGAFAADVNDIIFRGADYHYKGKLNEAIAAFQQAVRLAPDNEFAHNQLGLLYAKKERDGDAFREFSTVVQLDRRNTFALLWTGILYLKQNDMDKAFEAFQEVTSLDPNNADAYYFLGAIYNFRHHPVKAIEYLKKARDADSGEADTHYRLGRAFHRLDMINNAYLEYTRALKLKPAYTKAINEIGWIYYNQGNYQAAIDQWNNALSINPKDTDAISNLAKVYNDMAYVALSQNKTDDAIAFWKATLSVMPGNKAARYYLDSYRR